MQINITHQNFELTDAIKSYAEQKLGAVSKYIKNSEDTTLSIEIGRVSLHHKHENTYEVKSHLRLGSRNIHIEAVNGDVYAAIDEAKDKLADEVKHDGDKKRSIFKRVARKFKSIIQRGN